MDAPATLLSNLILFGRRLQERGLKITPDRVLSAGRALQIIDFANRGDFAAALRANFVSKKEELPLFEKAFEEFWSQKRRRRKGTEVRASKAKKGEGANENSLLLPMRKEIPASEEEGDGEKEKRAEYSPHEVLMAKDFSQYLPEEQEALQRELIRLISQIARRLSRRREPSAKGREIDFRRSLRRALPYGGEILELVRRRKKMKPLRIIVLGDVSGSMDPSTRFLLQFFFELHRVFRRCEIFVFSTRLTRITDILKKNRWAEGLTALSKRVSDWSGGTQIGNCLKSFNDRFAPILTGESAVLILISDGWDRGDSPLLDQEMKRLKRRAKRLIWMNPLLGMAEYQPICQGMRTALPYIDYFLPANTLGGIKRMADLLGVFGEETN